MSNFLILGYTAIGACQSLTTIVFLSDNRRKFNVHKVIEFPFVFTTAIISGTVWPISMPLLVHLDNKWSKN